MNEAEIEQYLREAYRSEDPPATLVDRLRTRARERHSPSRGPWLRRRAPLLGFCTALVALCAALVMGIVGIVRQQQDRAKRAQQAQAQLLYALQISSGELHWAENSITRDLNVGQKGARQ